MSEAVVRSQSRAERYRRFAAICTRSSSPGGAILLKRAGGVGISLTRLAAVAGLCLLQAGCSVTFPMFATSEPPASTGTAPAVAASGPSVPPEKPSAAAPATSAPSVAYTASLGTRPAARAQGSSDLADHLGPEDLRRASGAMALALDPQGNGSPVSWDNAESKSSGRFTPVGGPFLRDDEVCRAFLASLSTLMERHALQGTACRPSGGDWSIRDLKPWKQPG